MREQQHCHVSVLFSSELRIVALWHAEAQCLLVLIFQNSSYDAFNIGYKFCAIQFNITYPAPTGNQAFNTGAKFLPFSGHRFLEVFQRLSLL